VKIHRNETFVASNHLVHWSWWEHGQKWWFWWWIRRSWAPNWASVISQLDKLWIVHLVNDQKQSDWHRRVHVIILMFCYSIKLFFMIPPLGGGWGGWHLDLPLSDDTSVCYVCPWIEVCVVHNSKSVESFYVYVSAVQISHMGMLMPQNSMSRSHLMIKGELCAQNKCVGASVSYGHISSQPNWLWHFIVVKCFASTLLVPAISC